VSRLAATPDVGPHQRSRAASGGSGTDGRSPAGGLAVVSVPAEPGDGEESVPVVGVSLAQPASATPRTPRTARLAESIAPGFDPDW